MSKLQELLVVKDEEIVRVREYYGKSADDLKRDVNLLQEWLKQQPHLPHDEDDNFLEKLLIANKCRIEKTKQKLETLYTYRALYPDVLAYYDFDGKHLMEALETFTILILPTLTPNLERCIYFKVKNPETFKIQQIYCICTIIEFLRYYDHSSSLIVLFDWEGTKLDMMKQLDISVIQKLYNLIVNALSGRFSHIIYLNTPTYAQILHKILKLVFKPELYKRIKSYSSIEEVYEIIPKEMMPRNYGGNGKSTEELQKMLREEMKYHKEFFNTVVWKKSNEKLRINPIKYNELFGTDGTFKKLNLD